MGRRCGSLKPAPTPLDDEITKSIGNEKQKGKTRGLFVTDRKTVKENHRHIT